MQSYELTEDPEWGYLAVTTLDTPDGDELDRLTSVAGEVVLVLERSDASVWLHTKEFYPGGTYRLPTGKLLDDEIPDDGFARELFEETGFVPPSPKRIARIRYYHDTTSYRFVSYIFHVTGADDTLCPVDETEEIVGWKPVSIPDLDTVAAELRNLPDRFVGWGQFRAVAHEVVAELSRRGNT
jgi:8-oxo-dGTP pyrophosphatase MutT (NUDIX family)